MSRESGWIWAGEERALTGPSWVGGLQILELPSFAALMSTPAYQRLLARLRPRRPADRHPARWVGRR